MPLITSGVSGPGRAFAAKPPGSTCIPGGEQFRRMHSSTGFSVRRKAGGARAGRGSDSGRCQAAGSSGESNGNSRLEAAVRRGNRRRRRKQQELELKRIADEIQDIQLTMAPRALQSEVDELKLEINKQQGQLSALQARLKPRLLPKEAPGSGSNTPERGNAPLPGYEFTQRLDVQKLPKHIILVRHAQSLGNVDEDTYATTPDWRVPLSEQGIEQALSAGLKIKEILHDAHGDDRFRLAAICSPYRRCVQTMDGILEAFPPNKVVSMRQEVQLREQDFGNFQDPDSVKRDKAARLRYGRFFFRFPHGESGADVYSRTTMVADDLVRDIMTGRHGSDTSILIVSHGLSLRILLMTWFEWTVDECNAVWNPPNATPLVLERIEGAREMGGLDGENLSWMQMKAMYRVSSESVQILRGCTNEMCTMSLKPRNLSSLDD